LPANKLGPVQDLRATQRSLYHPFAVDSGLQ
jgi:hypothetical protein